MNKLNNLLAIDVGNTTISYGWFQGSKMKTTGFVKNGNIPALIQLIKKRGVSQEFSVVMSSVVPRKANLLKQALRKSFKDIKIWSIGENLALKVAMKYRKSTLGADRLVNIYGAKTRFKGPVLMIDYGTAITFDYVSKKGIFEGGLIVPGIETSWKALQERAALLPKNLKLTRTGEACLASTNTKSAMYSGLLNGFGALSDGLIERFKKKYGKMTVIATGGSSSFISKYSTRINIVDPFHTLRSLNLIFQNIVIPECLNRGSKS